MLCAGSMPSTRDSPYNDKSTAGHLKEVLARQPQKRQTPQQDTQSSTPWLIFQPHGGQEVGFLVFSHTPKNGVFGMATEWDGTPQTGVQGRSGNGLGNLGAGGTWLETGAGGDRTGQFALPACAGEERLPAESQSANCQQRARACLRLPPVHRGKRIIKAHCAFL